MFTLETGSLLAAETVAKISLQKKKAYFRSCLHYIVKISLSKKGLKIVSKDYFWSMDLPFSNPFKLQNEMCMLS